MMRRAFLSLLLLSACAHTPAEPRVITQQVSVPVAVPCHPKLQPEPDYPDTDARIKAAPDDIFVLSQALLAGRELRTQRIQELTAALSACQ